VAGHQLRGGQRPQAVPGLAACDRRAGNGDVLAGGPRTAEVRIAARRTGGELVRWPPEHDRSRSPYRGLKPLEGDDAGIFFGREAPTILMLLIGCGA